MLQLCLPLSYYLALGDLQCLPSSPTEDLDALSWPHLPRPSLPVLGSPELAIFLPIGDILLLLDTVVVEADSSEQIIGAYQLHKERSRVGEDEQGRHLAVREQLSAEDVEENVVGEIPDVTAGSLRVGGGVEEGVGGVF